MSGRHPDIAAYVDDRLTPEARQEAEKHLVRCLQCCRTVEDLRLTRNQELRALGNFPGRLLRGSLEFLHPVLKSLPQNGTQPEAKEQDEPLRLLSPRVMGGVRGASRFVGRFGLVLLLTAAALLLPTPEGLSEVGHRSLGAFVFTAAILALEPVSLPIAALMVPLALVALGTADTPQAFATFSRPVVFLILASLFLAEALRKHGLTRRLALSAIVTSGGGIGPLLLSLMATSAFFSMWVGNTATAAMLIPVALTISKQISEKEEARRLVALLALGVVYSASLGGMVTIMGASANAVASGFLADIGDWTFLDWMRYGLPSFVLLFPLTWYLLFKLMPLGTKRLDVAPAREQAANMGPMSPTEWEIIAIIAVAAVLWVGGPILETALGLPKTLFSSAMVAVIAVAYLAIREIIDWEDLKGVSWGIFLIIGAGLSLGETLFRTGVTDWFAALIAPLVTGLPLLASLLMLVLLSAVLTNLVNNTTIAAVFVPVLITLSQAEAGFSAVQLVLPVTLATTFGYSLPSASGRMAMLSATGLVDRGTMMRYGLILTVVSSLVLGGFFYALAQLGWI